jgi:hypothetical protein
LTEAPITVTEIEAAIAELTMIRNMRIRSLSHELKDCIYPHYWAELREAQATIDICRNVLHETRKQESPAG